LRSNEAILCIIRSLRRFIPRDDYERNPELLINMKTNFFDRSIDELAVILEDLGQTPYRLDQVLNWAYVRTVPDFSGMTNLSAGLREKLSDILDLDPLTLVDRKRSRDGTEKLLLSLEDGELVETVLIQEKGYMTQCLSTQAGCGMGCTFCESARDGLSRDLTRGEIIAQVATASRVLGNRRRLRNLVFMGMGEPLKNLDEVVPSLEIILDSRGFDFSPRRVTISTCGWVPGIKRLSDEGLGVNLAISLNAGDDGTRTEIMPVNRIYSIKDLIKAAREYLLNNRQRITFEYVLIDGLNDSDDDAMKVAGLLKGIPCKVNLIPCSETSAGYMPSGEARSTAFQKVLLDSGILATVRSSRGSEIGAACGQLRANAAKAGV